MQDSALAYVQAKSIAGRTIRKLLEVKVYFGNGHHHSFRLFKPMQLAIVRILILSEMLYISIRCLDVWLFVSVPGWVVLLNVHFCFWYCTKDCLNGLVSIYD